MDKKSPSKEHSRIWLIGTILTALITFCGICVTAYFGYLNNQIQVKAPIEATQTAEVELSSNLATSEPIETSNSLPATVIPKPTNTTIKERTEEINLTLQEDSDTQTENGEERQQFVMEEHIPIRWEGIYNVYEDKTAYTFRSTIRC